jgi:hypothetical protein
MKGRKQAFAAVVTGVRNAGRSGRWPGVYQWPLPAEAVWKHQDVVCFLR